jgi:hypothetical protein
MDACTINYQKLYTTLKEGVSKMRLYQQAFFKSRDPADLRRAKALEKEVDEMIHPKPQQQQSLFTDEFLGR